MNELEIIKDWKKAAFLAKDYGDNIEVFNMGVVSILLHKQAQLSYEAGQDKLIKELKKYILIGIDCEQLHHPKDCMHNFGEACPVEERVNNLLTPKTNENNPQRIK